MANLTEYSNRTATPDIFCMTGFYAAYQKLLILVVNITLFITAFLGNILIIIVLKRVSSLRSASKPALVRLSCKHRSLRWSHYSASFRGLYNVSRTLHALLLSFNPLWKVERNSWRSICVNANCYKCRKTSRLVVGAKVQTSCDIKTRPELCCYELVFQHRHYIDINLRRANSAIDCMHSDSPIHSHFDLLLHKNLSDARQSSSSSTRACLPRTIKRRRKTNEYNSIQKDNVYGALWIQIALVVCYLPYGIAAIFVIKGLRTQFLDFAWKLTLSLFMLNSTLNPLLYCWKIKEIRQAVIDTFRRFSCFLT